MLEGIIKRGTILTIVILIICILGLLAAFRIPVQMIPDLEVRTITVETRWPGATPQDIEKEILIEQEEYLRNVPYLERMISLARTGEAEIELEFPFGVNVDDALIRVNNALTQVSDYPENVDEPRLHAASFSENSFMYYRIAPLDNNAAGLDMDMMYDYVDNTVRTRLERVPGVSQVRVGGGAERQIQIYVDPERLAARGLSMVDVRDAIRQRNRDYSGGDIDVGKRRYLLRTVGRFTDISKLERLVLSRQGDSITRLADIAEIRLDHAEIRGEWYVNGDPVINLSIRRETGSNVIDIKNAMAPAVAELNSDVLEPAGMRMTLTTDDVRYVQASLKNVWRNLIIGALLATGVMFLFLRSAPATLVGVMGIPICTIAAFIGLLAFGRTINVISLAGVAFAIGMTLDNTIVVLENIERERRRGLGKLEAALAGVKQVWPAVLASTMTTVLVFSPVLFVDQEAGQLYSDIAIAISAAILASMLIAITAVPAAASRIPAKTGSGKRDEPAWQRRVLAAVDWLLASKLRRYTCIIGTVGFTVLVMLALTPPAEYLPEGEEAKTFSVMSPPPGYNLPEMSAIGDEIQAHFLPHLQADPDAYEAGETDIPPLMYFNLSIEPSRLRVIAETENPAHINALMQALTDKFEQYPGMRAFASRGSIISSNDGGTRSVTIDVSGPSLAEIYEVAGRIYQRAEAAFDNPQIRADPSSLSLSQPLILVEPDEERIAELGMSVEDVGFSVAALADGAYVDEFLLANDKVDIYLYRQGGAPQGIDELRNLPLHVPGGNALPVASLASVEESVDTDQIRRLNGQRTVTVYIIPPRGVALETAVGVVKKEVIQALRDSGELPSGISMDISGASDQLDATREALWSNYLVAVVLCYLLMVAIFTHWGFPLVVLTAVPLGIAGGIAGLWLMNVIGGWLPAIGLSAIIQPFDMITMLGFLILVGTVVNNPILIVEQTRYNLNQGMDSQAAVRMAVAARLRPILMTTITTSFGLAPLVLLPGAGTELYRGVGAIVLFGLVFTMLVTLTFLPTLLMSILDWRKAKNS
ncbi:MAG: efflux RND transporter permease subunit [Nevskiales bacterium]